MFSINLTIRYTLLLCLFGFTVLAQNVKQTAPVDLTTLNYTVEEAPEWSALFNRQSGWFGGDGIYTIALNGVSNRQARPGEQVFFIFSDSMIGEISDGKLQPGFKMIHNSFAVLKGGEADKKEMNFYWNNNDNKADNVFIPNTTKTGKGDYYWLGSGLVNQKMKNTLYLFGYRIKTVSTEAFGFHEVGNTLIKIDKGTTPLNGNYKQMDTPFFFTDNQGGEGSFGTAVFVNTKTAGASKPDGYIYVYGQSGMDKKLFVARVLPADFESFFKWTFLSASGWVANIKDAEKVTDKISNEMSVTELPDGRYALICQVGGLSSDIGLRIGKTPYGPFGPVIKIWDCSNDLKAKTYVAYNAKAHPVISKPGELIISYNINSLEFDKDLQQYPNLYRPRFIRLKLK